MKVSGFSIIKNGEKLGYPYIESICSLLPICDEVVIAVGKSEDATREKIVAIGNAKIKIIDTVWDDRLREGGRILAQQTNLALEHISGDWGFYLQGDEVLHEQYYDTVLNAMKLHLNDKRVEGLLFRYRHFYGSYSYVGTSPAWYRNEIRVVRSNSEIRSYRDAQGFRKVNGGKLGVKSIDAEIYHYGWCRPPRQMQEKVTELHKLYHNDQWLEEHVEKVPEYKYNLRERVEPFQGTHPMVMSERVKNYSFPIEFSQDKTPLKPKDRFRLWVEKYTGIRLWEYRNYRLIRYDK